MPRQTTQHHAFHRPTGRPSFVAGQATVSAYFITVLLGAWLIATAGPIPQDAHTLVTVETLPSALPSGTLDTPIHFCQFLDRYGIRSRSTDPLSYLRDFRRSLAEFEAGGWSGDCNDFANAICDAGYRRGFPMGIVSMWPRDWRQRLTKDWHQFAVLCVEPGRDYLIFEFGDVIRWRGTLPEYAQSLDKEILPIGGILDWRPTRPHVLARLVDHLRGNVDLPANRLPLRLRSNEAITSRSDSRRPVS